MIYGGGIKMRKCLNKPMAVCAILIFSSPATAADPPESGLEEAVAAEADYQRYCSLCHGAERQGHVNDDAPSLRSKSLMSAGAEASHSNFGDSSSCPVKAATLITRSGTKTRKPQAAARP